MLLPFVNNKKKQWMLKLLRVKKGHNLSWRRQQMYRVFEIYAGRTKWSLKIFQKANKVCVGGNLMQARGQISVVVIECFRQCCHQLFPACCAFPCQLNLSDTLRWITLTRLQEGPVPKPAEVNACLSFDLSGL